LCGHDSDNFCTLREVLWQRGGIVEEMRPNERVSTETVAEPDHPDWLLPNFTFPPPDLLQRLWAGHPIRKSSAILLTAPATITTVTTRWPNGGLVVSSRRVNAKPRKPFTTGAMARNDALPVSQYLGSTLW
jgi:hypothetical protein